MNNLRDQIAQIILEQHNTVIAELIADQILALMPQCPFCDERCTKEQCYWKPPLPEPPNE